MYSSNPTEATTPAHLLIAEDSGVQALMLRQVLQQEGYLTTVAGDGETALKLATRIRPALIISDVNMPGTSGYELCRRIKADPELSATPVILVTSLSEPEDVLLGLESGANSFIIKPYDRTHLLDRIRHFLSTQLEPPSTEGHAALEIAFNGREHQITASRRQILELLMSTYTATAHRNKELHESREQLRQTTSDAVATNRFLDSVIENIPDMVFLKDASDLRFARLNAAGEELLGYRREELLGKSDYDFFPREEADLFVAKDREVLAHGRLVEIREEPIHTAAKGIRLLRTKKVAVTDGNGVTTHLMGISEDVTDQKELERQVLALNAALEARAHELEAVNKGLEGFTSAATHDLRSPLNAIGGFARLLDKTYGSTLDPKGQRYLSMISSGVDGMVKLIDDLLAFSKAGLRGIAKQHVDMTALVQEVISSWTQSHPGHDNLAVSLGDLPAVQADPALLKQVWINLFSNSVKYSSRKPNPTIDITGEIAHGEVIYSIRDNGAGFDMAQYDKLFSIFERLHTDSDFEGTGVGLPIVQRVVSRHGGRVWAHGVVGKGAVFQFSLPLEPGNG